MLNIRFILYLIILKSIHGKPQLNLPPLTSPRPDVYSNSYTANRLANNENNFDRDRSSRYGPPYGSLDSSDDDDRPNDYRQGSSDREMYGNRNRFNQPIGGLNNYNETRSPFSSDYNRQSDYRSPDSRFGTTKFPDFNRQNNPTTDNYDRFNFPDNSRFNNPNNNRDTNRYNPNNEQYPANPFNSRPDSVNLDDRDRYESDRRYAFETEKLRNILIETDHRGSEECTANVAAQWNFETDVNELTQTNALFAQQKYADYQRQVYDQTKNIDENILNDRNYYRQLKLLKRVGSSGLPPDQLDRLNRIINDMLVLYNGGSVCGYQQPFQCNLKLNPDLKEIMAHSRDWDELQYIWTEFHRKNGRNMRDNYEQLIDLMNEVALVNNFTNAGEYWFSAYEATGFRSDLELVWQEIQPLYELLHAYVRRKLREFYGPDRINRNAPLPAHIFGNMYSQKWSNILDLIIPYPGRSFIDVTPKMLEQGYTPLVMFQLAEEFFLSLNMSGMPTEFWSNSILEQPPPDRVTLCQPSAWDFCNRHDFRIKMCTKITQKDLINVHHEMSHIQYFLNYRHHPKTFRDGANPGFHEAIGDAIGLSVSTPKHLQTLGLIQKSVDDLQYDINYLFTMAVDKVAFLPFALALDAWRHDVFSRTVSREMLNCHYWNLREQYGGIKPPVLRSEMDFDPGAKYHIPANIPYIKYFVGTVLQFQIYRAMCRVSRQYIPNDPQKPLHKCDIYRQPEAGNLLKQLMEKGASQPWQQTLEEVIGEGRLDGTALRDYFRPLEEWLRNENLRNQEYVGWVYDGDYCKRSIETANLQVYGGFYNGTRKLNQFNYYLLIAILISLFKM